MLYDPLKKSAPAERFLPLEILVCDSKNTFFRACGALFPLKSTVTTGENLTTREARRKKIAILK